LECYASEFTVSKLLGYNSSYDVINGDFRIGTQLRRKLHGSEQGASSKGNVLVVVPIIDVHLY
jgi:hypothetical protein